MYKVRCSRTVVVSRGFVTRKDDHPTVTECDSHGIVG